eukprot:363761-Chlamydomonas_euryale.AAC.29
MPTLTSEMILRNVSRLAARSSAGPRPPVVCSVCSAAASSATSPRGFERAGAAPLPARGRCEPLAAALMLGPPGQGAAAHSSRPNGRRGCPRCRALQERPLLSFIHNSSRVQTWSRSRFGRGEHTESRRRRRARD